MKVSAVLDPRILGSLAKSFFLFYFSICDAEKWLLFAKYNNFFSKINSAIVYSNSCAKLMLSYLSSFIPEDIRISDLSGDERSRALTHRQPKRALPEPNGH